MALSQRRKRNNQAGRPPFLDDVRKERDGEKIGGGYFIFRRGKGSGRIRAPEYPFEHPTEQAARDELERLRQQYPNEIFQIAQVS